MVVDGLQSMNASLESEEKVLRHFQTFGVAPVHPNPYMPEFVLYTHSLWPSLCSA